MIFFDVDTQRDFIDADGALAVPGAEEIRSNIERLLKAAEAHKITTISSRCAHEPNDPEFKIFPPHCIEGTLGAERIFPDLPDLQRYELPVNADSDPQTVIKPATHYVVKKKEFDLFSNKWLDGLRKMGGFRDQDCIVFGVATDYCVLACGLGLSSAGAGVRVIKDAIRGVAGDTTETAIQEMRNAGAVFIKTDDILNELNKP